MSNIGGEQPHVRIALPLELRRGGPLANACTAEKGVWVMALTSLQCHFVAAKIAPAFSVLTGQRDTMSTSFAPAARRRPSVSEAVADHHMYQQPDEGLRNGVVTLVKEEEFQLLGSVSQSGL